MSIYPSFQGFEIILPTKELSMCSSIPTVVVPAVVNEIPAKPPAEKPSNGLSYYGLHLCRLAKKKRVELELPKPLPNNLSNGSILLDSSLQYDFKLERDLIKDFELDCERNQKGEEERRRRKQERAIEEEKERIAQEEREKLERRLREEKEAEERRQREIEEMDKWLDEQTRKVAAEEEKRKQEEDNRIRLEAERKANEELARMREETREKRKQEDADRKAREEIERERLQRLRAQNQKAQLFQNPTKFQTNTDIPPQTEFYPQISPPYGVSYFTDNQPVYTDHVPAPISQTIVSSLIAHPTNPVILNSQNPPILSHVVPFPENPPSIDIDNMFQNTSAPAPLYNNSLSHMPLPQLDPTQNQIQHHGYYPKEPQTNPLGYNYNSPPNVDVSSDGKPVYVEPPRQPNISYAPLPYDYNGYLSPNSFQSTNGLSSIEDTSVQHPAQYEPNLHIYPAFNDGAENSLGNPYFYYEMEPGPATGGMQEFPLTSTAAKVTSGIGEDQTPVISSGTSSDFPPPTMNDTGQPFYNSGGDEPEPIVNVLPKPRAEAHLVPFPFKLEPNDNSSHRLLEPVLDSTPKQEDTFGNREHFSQKPLQDVYVDAARLFGDDQNRINAYLKEYELLRKGGFEGAWVKKALQLYFGNRENCLIFLNGYETLHEEMFTSKEINEAMELYNNDMAQVAHYLRSLKKLRDSLGYSEQESKEALLMNNSNLEHSIKYLLQR